MSNVCHQDPVCFITLWTESHNDIILFHDYKLFIAEVIMLKKHS